MAELSRSSVLADAESALASGTVDLQLEAVSTLEQLVKSEGHLKTDVLRTLLRFLWTDLPVAAEAEATLGIHGISAFDAIIDLFHEQEARLREGAARSISLITTYEDFSAQQRKQVTTELLQLLKDPSPGVQRESLISLAALNDVSAATVGMIRQMLASDDPDDVASCFVAIGLYYDDSCREVVLDEAVRRAIQHALDSPESIVRRTAARLIPDLQIGRKRRQAILTRLIHDDTDIATDAICQLQKLDTRENTTDLTDALLSALRRDKRIAREAARLLSQMSEADSAVISSLKELVGEEGITASVAIVPLFKLTHDFSLVSEKLARLLESAEAAFVAAACDSASLIGVDAQAVLPQLVSLIGSTDYGTRLAAADAVRAVGSDNRRTRSILRNALDHPEEDVREFAEDLLNDLRENRGPWWWHRLANWLVRPD